MTGGFSMTSPRARSWRRQMSGRDPGERHRASTPLELLFDLCFVVAVAQAAAQLSHGLAEGHAGPRLLGYVMVFFAIWWAWVNFTWFASAYDCDDVVYRLLTLLQIAGVLVLAAGVPAALDSFDFVIVSIGYVIMRVAMIAQWLRAAHEHLAGRSTALRYALGIGLCQIGWVARLALPGGWAAIGFAVLAVAELAVPVWAEARGAPTSWHPGHINERYGLFTLIVLGEVVAAATVAVQSGFSAHGFSASLLLVALGGLLLVFGVWWSYFKHDVTSGLRASSLGSTLLWGYGHYGVFAAIAALGAGLEVVAVATERHTELSAAAAALCVAVPTAVYLLIAGPLQARLNPTGALKQRYVVLAAAVMLLIAAGASLLTLPLAVLMMGLLLAALVAAGVISAHRAELATR